MGFTLLASSEQITTALRRLSALADMLRYVGDLDAGIREGANLAAGCIDEVLEGECPSLLTSKGAAKWEAMDPMLRDGDHETEPEAFKRISEGGREVADDGPYNHLTPVVVGRPGLSKLGYASEPHCVPVQFGCDPPKHSSKCPSYRWRQMNRKDGDE